jgi:hypothetical protein
MSLMASKMAEEDTKEEILKVSSAAFNPLIDSCKSFSKKAFNPSVHKFTSWALWLAKRVPVP